MFGIYRLTLALLVAAWHLYRDLAPGSGPQAVYCFFVLSGYLMTLTVNENYADGIPGVLRYLFNRALRIYPAYLACLLVAAGLLIAAPEVAGHFLRIGAQGWPHDVIPQITIVGLTKSSTWLIPSAWSLDVELVHYVLIGAIFARSRALTLAWLVLSVPFGAFVVPDEHWPVLQPQYVNYTGGSICFAAGAALAHFLPCRRGINPWLAAAAIASIPTLGVASRLYPDWARSWGMLAAMALAVCATMTLGRMSLDRLPASLRRVDDWCGRLAYPIFLAHFNAAILVMWLAPHRLPQPLLFMSAALLTIALSIVIVVSIERPLESLRRRLRARPTTVPPR